MGVLRSHFKKVYANYKPMNTCKPRRTNRVSTPQYSQAKLRKQGR